MEAEVAEMNDRVDITDLPDDATQNTVEESALSHDSEFDDLPGFPETTNIAENENEEPNSLEAVQEICFKGEYFYVII